MGEAGAAAHSRSLRKRAEQDRTPSSGLEPLLEQARDARKVIVFSGSGLSATSGMSMFSTANGLYQRACKRFGIADGKKLFTWRFFEKQRTEVTSFFVDIHKEAVRARAGTGHCAVAELEAAGKLLRHYTMNVDGLASHSGMSVWHRDSNPDGKIVELHGNARYLICPECGHTAEATSTDLIHMKRYKPRICTACGKANLRFKIMLYDDEKAEMITPEDVWTRFEDDLETADLIVWVGISFEQSASTEYFRKARCFLMDHERLERVPQFVVNPEDTAYTNLTSTCTNTAALNLCPVYLDADTAMQGIAAAAMADGERIAGLTKAASEDTAAVSVAAAAGATQSDSATTDTPSHRSSTRPVKALRVASPGATPPSGSSAERDSLATSAAVTLAVATPPIAPSHPPALAWGVTLRRRSQRRARTVVTGFPSDTEAAGVQDTPFHTPSAAQPPQLPRPPPLDPASASRSGQHGPVHLPAPLPRSPSREGDAAHASCSASHPSAPHAENGVSSGGGGRSSSGAPNCGLSAPMHGGPVKQLHQHHSAGAGVQSASNAPAACPQGTSPRSSFTAAGARVSQLEGQDAAQLQQQALLQRYAELTGCSPEAAMQTLLQAAQSAVYTHAQPHAHSHRLSGDGAAHARSEDVGRAPAEAQHASSQRSAEPFNPDTNPITVNSLYQPPQHDSQAAKPAPDTCSVPGMPVAQHHDLSAAHTLTMKQQEAQAMALQQALGQRWGGHGSHGHAGSTPMLTGSAQLAPASHEQQNQQLAVARLLAMLQQQQAQEQAHQQQQAQHAAQQQVAQLQQQLLQGAAHGGVLAGDLNLMHVVQCMQYGLLSRESADWLSVLLHQQQQQRQQQQQHVQAQPRPYSGLETRML